MAFGIGTNTAFPDSGVLRGKQEMIACDCWFSSTGTTIPRLIKYQDADSEIHTIKDLCIHYSEKKLYCGISMIEYTCSTVQEGQRYDFVLLFFIEECKWKIIWKSSSDS